MTGRGTGLAVVIAILLVAASGVCLLDGDHGELDLCQAMLPATGGAVLAGLLVAGTLGMPPRPPHPSLLPARTTPAPI